MRACARRSRCASLTRPMSPMARYRRPPCISLDEALDVAPATSPRSTTATRAPERAAYQAVAAPIAPAPMTRMSNGALDRRSSSSSRRSGTTRATTSALAVGWRTRRSCPPPSRSECRAARRRGAPARASRRGRRACASGAGRARARGRSRGRRRAPSRSGCPAVSWSAIATFEGAGVLADVRERLLHRPVDEVLDRERVAVDRRCRSTSKPPSRAASSARSRTAAWRPCASSSGGRSSNVIRRVRSTAVHERAADELERLDGPLGVAAPRSPASRDRA